MESQDLRDIANGYMQIWNFGQENLLDRYAHRNITVDYPHFEKAFEGIEDYKTMLKLTYHFFPDISISILRIIPNTEENNITVLWKYDGTHKNGNLFGAEPSGKKVSVNGMSLLDIENGLVIKESGIVDNLSLLMQLGAMETGIRK